MLNTSPSFIYTINDKLVPIYTCSNFNFYKVRVFFGDFNKRGTTEFVVSYFEGNQRFPVEDYINMSEQIPMLAEKYPQYTDYAQATLEEVLGEGNIKNEIQNMIALLALNSAQSKWNVIPPPSSPTNTR